MQKLRLEGKTIPQWSAENGLPVRSVRAVLYGHKKGHFGLSHRIAVAIGLKVAVK
jgi:gp16 family phage-associated protein